VIPIRQCRRAESSGHDTTCTWVVRAQTDPPDLELAFGRHLLTIQPHNEKGMWPQISKVHHFYERRAASAIHGGRLMANTHYGWRECYFLFAKSHYYPAARVGVFYMVHKMLTENFEQSSLRPPMVILLLSATLWVIAPIIFCPQPTWMTIVEDMSEFWSFCIATPEWSIRTLKRKYNRTTESMLRVELEDPRSSLYELWLKDALAHKREHTWRRFLALFSEIGKLLLFLSVVYSSMVDNLHQIALLFAFHFVMMELWRLLYRPTAITLIVMLMWLTAPWFICADSSTINVITTIAVCYQMLNCGKEFGLLLGWFYYMPDSTWTKLPETTPEERARKEKVQRQTNNYDVLVEYFFVNFMEHLMLLFMALGVLILQFITQVCMVLLDMCWGIHSWMLLNGRLASKGFCAERTGYRPGEEAGITHREPSNRLRALQGGSGSGLRIRDELRELPPVMETIDEDDFKGGKPAKSA